MGFEYKTYLVFFINSYSCLFIFIELQNLLRVLDPLFGGRFYTLKLVRNPQFFPLVLTQSMVGKNFYFHDGIQSVNSSINTDISYAFSAGQQYICGGLLGACVSVFMEQMVQKVASYIILSITLIVLASFITNVSFFAEFFKWARNVMFGAKNKYSELKEEYDRRMEERMLAEEYEDEYTDDVYEDEYYEEEASALDAANSFANDTKNNTKKSVTKPTAKKSSKTKEKPIKEVTGRRTFFKRYR